MVHIEYRGHCIADHESWPCKQMAPKPVDDDVKALAHALEAASRYEDHYLDDDPERIAADLLMHLPDGWRLVREGDL